MDMNYKDLCIDLGCDEIYTVLNPFTPKLFVVWIENFWKPFEMLKKHLCVIRAFVVAAE